jgi:type I restriction enzyme, R subunit
VSRANEESAYLTPEGRARVKIDRMLNDAGWSVQQARGVNLRASRGVAVREFVMRSPHGRADYLLFLDGQAVGALEAKKEGETLTGVAWQTAKYVEGIPDDIPTALEGALPFVYQSTGTETRFTNTLDPEPTSRDVFWFHRPETLAGWLDEVLRHPAGATLRHRLRQMPPPNLADLWPPKDVAVRNLEESLAQNRPRALIQMATGSGKTLLAAFVCYRLIKDAGAKRILFLVDRANLGRQTLKEFQGFTVPDVNRKFTELYNVQHLSSNRIDDVSRVTISTIQRLYATLRGDAELDEELDEHSAADVEPTAPVEVAYNPAVPPETFDVIVVDEAHRSIYGVWRQVLDYFDSFVIGLTATPNKQAFGFFNQNLVMEYTHDQAVADQVNVDFDVYRIRTQITESGSTVDAGLVTQFRDRKTRARRWQQLDDEVTYGAEVLDRAVVAQDQIRTVLETFRDRLFTEIFPGRSEVPKTLIFAKDDSHADDIVQIAREVFGKGDDFAAKITYKATGRRADELIKAFRNSYNPRIAVTVDMIATGTDVRPLECVFFMRSVKSRTYFEQMKGRGVRVWDSGFEPETALSRASLTTHAPPRHTVCATTPEFYPSRLAPMEIYNLNGDEWNLETEHEDYVFKDCWVGARIGAELIGGSMYEVAPGKKQGPYHTHHGNEEWAIVIRGRPTLRTPEGERDLREGDVVCFPRGKAGAHQVINRTDEPARVLVLSTLLTPDVVEYLDSGVVAATSPADGRLFYARVGPDVEYWAGE